MILMKNMFKWINEPFVLKHTKTQEVYKGVNFITDQGFRIPAVPLLIGVLIMNRFYFMGSLTDMRHALHRLPRTGPFTFRNKSSLPIFLFGDFVFLPQSLAGT